MNKQQTSWLIQWTLGWHNPYSPPGKIAWNPNVDFTGWPREVWEARLPRGVQPDGMLPEWYKPGCGWSVLWRGPVAPADYVPRRLSLEAKQKMRRGNLVRRINKAAPLFAEQLIPQELGKDAEYFGTAENAGNRAK